MAELRGEKEGLKYEKRLSKHAVYSKVVGEKYLQSSLRH